MLSVLPLLFIGGCIKKQPESKIPIVQGHRINDVFQQPLQALEHAYQQKYPSIEVDVSLTSDQILIMHHDYWLNPDTCTYKNENRTLIKDHTWKQIQQEATCVHTILSMEELFASSMLPDHILINLDIKYHPTFTQPKEQFIVALIKLISQYPNRKIMITASNIHIVQALKSELSIPILLEYPFFSSSNQDHQNIMLALYAKIKNTLGITRFRDLVVQSHADGISLPFQIVSLRDVDILNKDKMMIQLFTMQNSKDSEKFCTWPIDILISDIPENAPCFRPHIETTAD